MPLRREVVVLVAVGAVLGVVQNAIGLASRPPRGIPWVAQQGELPSLEDVTPADSVTAAPGGINAPPTASPPPPASTGARPGGSAVTSPPPPKNGATTASPSGSNDRPDVPVNIDPRRVAPLPFIPDSDQPIQVQVATTKRFFDARAALFLDARDAAEYEKGHIPGAIRLTNAEAQNEPERVKALPVTGRAIICYCEGGTCEASLDLARFLLESGFKKVLVYMGGYPEWEAAGHPVERGSGR
ncbi:MAG: rhodanese-like domain-containing protein [Candidatus Eiseniibacteriota bacterium]